MEQVGRTVVASFRKYWQKTGAMLLHDSNSRYGCFEAASLKERKKLAKAFYSKSHTNKMAKLSDDQILKQLNPLVRHLACLPKREVTQRKVSEIISNEYLLFETKNEILNFIFGTDDADVSEIDPYLINLDKDNIRPWMVSSYPAYAIDDWYERVGGLNPVFFGVLMKSTGEPFSKTERRMLAQSVVKNVTSEGRDEFWVFDIRPVIGRKNQIVIYIASHWPKSFYIDPIIEAIRVMGEGSCREFAARLCGLEEDIKEDLPKNLLRVALKYCHQKERGSKMFKQKIISIINSAARFENEIHNIEDQLRPYIFNGREYFHSVNYDGIEFFDQLI